ncbi:hypothetical protein [Vibrio sp. D431a]|uniref:hypothetical protein n=1 Tax=Vibrio sp. D431a TaxID=2837388 RepID=UPI002555FE94|nr:hypothetical protein [Vibrio sp. D431a]MDK9795081.1 hypothetical protein [Vibrio sp. D431a]
MFNPNFNATKVKIKSFLKQSACSVSLQAKQSRGIIARMKSLLKKLMKLLLGQSNEVVINGQKFTGRSVSIIGDEVKIDGKSVDVVIHDENHLI